MKKLKLLLAFCALLLGWSNASAQGWTASEVAAGNFYLYNVGANAYLENGASWGTHAALKNGGFVVNVAAVGGGKYTIGTNSKYSGKYFTQNGYVDSGSSTNWTFEPVEGKANTYRLKTDEGYYAIAASGMYNVTFRNEGDNEAYWWKLVTVDNRNAGTNATYLTPVEWTHKINNPRFDDDNSGWNDAPARGGNTGGTNGNEGSFDDRNPCAEHYNKTYDTYQELTGLSNGVYAVSVQGFYREGGYAAAAPKHVAGTESLNAILYANDAEQPLMSIFEEAGKASGGNTVTASGIDGAFPNDMAAASYFFSAGLYWNTVYVEVTDGTLKIGVKKSTSVGADWTIFDSFRLQYYGDDCTVEQAKNAAVKKAWDDAYSAAVSARDNAAYENVVGAERTALNTEIAKEEPTTAEGYVTATQSLSTATSNFIAAAPNYVLLATEKTKAENLGLSAAAIAEVTPLTKTGLKALQDLKVAEYNYVTTTYPYGVTLGEWTSTGTNTSAATFNNEHWSGTTHDYKNQNDGNGQGWNANSWSINFSQDVLLPAGTYVFKVAGRQASGNQVTTSLVVKKGEEELGSVNDFPRSNNSRGINKSGATAFEGEASEFANGGNGFGWEWRYVKFTLAEEATVNIAINSVATAIHQWVSFGDYTLQADNDDVVDILAYNVAKASAITVRDDAQYVNVTGSERTALVNAINADPSSDYPAATTALNEATTAFTGAKTSYDNFVTAKAAETLTKRTANVGTGVFQVSYTENSSLWGAYEDARGQADGYEITSSSTASEVNALATSLTSAQTAYSEFLANPTLNAPDASKHYNIIVATAEHPKNGNAVVESLGATSDNNPTGYAFNASATPNVNLAQAVKFTQVSGNTYNISFETSEGVVYLTYGSLNGSAAGWATQQIQGTTDSSKKGEFKIAATATANVFNIYNTITNSTIACQTGGSLYTEAGNADFTIAETSQAFVAINIASDVKYATRIFPFTPELPSGVKAYSCDAATGSELTLVEVAEPQANVPYILEATSGYEGDALTGWGTLNTVDAKTIGWLTGVYTATAAPVGSYVLQNNNDKVAFYLVAEGEQPTVGANRCYLTTGVSGSARAAFFFRGDITGVENVEAATEATLKDGKYLEKGKIVIVKNGVKYNAAGAQVK